MSIRSKPELREGTIIDKKYAVEALIGEGSMGRVYCVRHLKMDKSFALKLMSFDPNRSGTHQLARFVREAKLLVWFDHPNVVKITDFGIHEGDSPYLVMELLEGLTLRELLKRRGRLSVQSALTIAQQICAGVHAGHQKELIHCNLKPENIIIGKSPDGDIAVSILDFSTARLFHSEVELNANTGGGLTMIEIVRGTGEAAGKAQHSSQYKDYEQLLGEAADASSDQFAIACIIYEMLSGVPPATAGKPDSIIDLRPETPPWLATIVHKGLLPDREDRYESVQVLRQELKGVGQTIKGKAASKASASRKADKADKAAMLDSRARAQEQAGAISAAKPNRRWLIIAAAGLILSLMIGGAFLTIWPKLKGQISDGAANGRSTTAGRTGPIPEAAIPLMLSIKGDKFQMGSNNGPDQFADPQHLVLLAPFEVGKFLVTNSQYAEFVKQTGHTPPQNWANNAPPRELSERAVTYVSWIDAVSYCNWLSSVTGKRYRLLMESEWEFLARNNSKYDLSEITGDLLEWTGSEFKLYPGSKAKLPPMNGPARIFRGKSLESVKDPLTYRFFQYENYLFRNLSFRVARDTE